MPKCIECPSFDSVKQVCTVYEKHRPRSAVRSCVQTIVESQIKDLSETKQNEPLRLLEIGAGVWKHPRYLCGHYKIEWNGVDPRWKESNPNRKMWHGRASKIPLPDNHFDMVVAFETMEHWTEWQDSPINGLREINRVLKPGRKLVVTVPIHLHGGDEFVSGDIEKILGYFDLSQWDVKTYEWRREHAPLPVHKGFNNSRRRKIYTQLTEEGFAKQTVQKEPSTWCLNIVAVKR